ncbi:hypothetical protein Tco_0271967 [Tanacetum coccineum]
MQRITNFQSIMLLRKKSTDVGSIVVPSAIKIPEDIVWIKDIFYKVKDKRRSGRPSAEEKGYYDEEGVITDFNSLPTEIEVSPTPTLRIHNIHQKEEPKKIAEALQDDSWVQAMQEELLQFKLQQVWVLVDLPHGMKVIGTKWVYRNKRDERGQERIISWRYYDTCRVHYLNLESMDIYMLIERKYPLSAEICKAMLDKKLQGGKPDEDCYKMLKMMEKQAGIRK